MSSVELLDKTRKINRLLYDNQKTKVVFNDICDCMGRLIDSSSFVLSKKGKVLGSYNISGDEEILPFNDEVGEFIKPEINLRLLEVRSTQENVNTDTLGLKMPNGGKWYMMVAPIYIGGERLGTLVVCRDTEGYSIDDIIVTEYTTTVVGLEIMRSESEEHAEEDRRVRNIRSAIASLSSSESKAMRQVLRELDSDEGIIVASRVADEVGITRSVIVNGLRKLESAGIIECHSSGMRGTFIKILNDDIQTEINA